MWWAGGFCVVLAKRNTKTVCPGLFLRVVCRRDMPFLEKIANITMSGRHVGTCRRHSQLRWIDSEEW